MATYNRKIQIQKLDIETEQWNDYFKTSAEINKSSGKEYFNASTNITSGTYNFKVRYCNKLKELKYDTASYRIVYDNQIFNLKNVDDPFENHHDLTLVGELVGR